MIDFGIPLAGLNTAQNSVNQIATRIAGNGVIAGGGDSVDLSTDMVNLIQARNSFAANTKVVHTEDQMTKSLLDMVG